MRVESLSLQTIRKVLVVPGEREQERVRGNGEKGEREEGHPAAAAFSRFLSYSRRGGTRRERRGEEEKGVKKGKVAQGEERGREEGWKGLIIPAPFPSRFSRTLPTAPSA